jgi:hypothetical protein
LTSKTIALVLMIACGQPGSPRTNVLEQKRAKAKKGTITSVQRLPLHVADGKLPWEKVTEVTL